MENSVVGRVLLSIWYVVYRWYEGSGVCRLLRGISRVWTRWFHGSALMNLLVRDGIFPKAWRDSFFCALAETIINLPGRGKISLTTASSPSWALPWVARPLPPSAGSWWAS